MYCTYDYGINYVHEEGGWDYEMNFKLEHVCAINEIRILEIWGLITVVTMTLNMCFYKTFTRLHGVRFN
jgi:hypothetical protein